MRLIILSFILIFFLSNFTFSQTSETYNEETINVVDATNKKQGKWIFFDNSKTQIVEEGTFVNNRRDGIWKKYYSSGKIKHEITYVKGKPNGYAKFYYENGNLSEEGLWKGTKWVGEYKFYFENGNMAYLWQHDETGKRTGQQKYFYENGNIMIEGEWTEGKESGVIKEYYESGDLKSEKNFADGILEQGTVKTYKPKAPVVVKKATGTKQESVGIFDGNGYHKTYNTKGLLDREGVFTI